MVPLQLVPYKIMKQCLAWYFKPQLGNRNILCQTFFSFLKKQHNRKYLQFKFHMNYIIEGEGALVNEKGKEQPLKAGDFALVDPNAKHQYRNKGDMPFKMICGVPKEFE